MSQQLKLSNFIKRKGDNDDAVTGTSKQSKSSFIDDVEIVHPSPVSMAVTKNGRCGRKKCQKTVSGFMVYRFCLARV